MPQQIYDAMFTGCLIMHSNCTGRTQKEPHCISEMAQFLFGVDLGAPGINTALCLLTGLLSGKPSLMLISARCALFVPL